MECPELVLVMDRLTLVCSVNMVLLRSDYYWLAYFEEEVLQSAMDGNNTQKDPGACREGTVAGTPAEIPYNSFNYSNNNTPSFSSCIQQ